MQPGTPPRQLSRRVNGHGVSAIPAVDSDYSKQFDSQLSLSATDARPHRPRKGIGRGAGLSSRSLALDHS
jgi:hypothetical protein